MREKDIRVVVFTSFPAAKVEQHFGVELILERCLQIGGLKI